MLLTSRQAMRRALMLLLVIATFAVSCGSDDPGEGQSDLTIKPEFPGSDDGLSELEMVDLVVGSGAEATDGSLVAVQYVGWLAEDGSQFDASWDRGRREFSFELGQGQVIRGWDQGVVGMREGGRRVLRIPSDLAYGPQGQGGTIGPNADLVFTVDLVSVQAGREAALPAQPAPPIPDEALGFAVSELEIDDLVAGDGPPLEVGQIAWVQYVGATADDGVIFDSTWGRGGVAVSLAAGSTMVIDGWKTGLLGMRAGGERVLRIPADQAFGDRDLAFRVHLERIEPAPVAHQISLDGAPTDDVAVTTLTPPTDGSPVAGPDDRVRAHTAVWHWRAGDLVASTYPSGQTQVLQLDDPNTAQALTDALVGIGEGEVRQIAVPATIAYPDAAGTTSGPPDDEVVVFVIEAVEVIAS